MTSPARRHDPPASPRYQAATRRLPMRITPTAANGAVPPADRSYRLPEKGPLPDLPLYERLISDGTVAADARITALARQDPDTQTVTLVLDATTASIAIFAIAAHADEREAHVREVQQFSMSLPEDSYARRNRQAIAARETRIATRLCVVEHACQAAIDRDTAPTSPEPAQPSRSPEHAAEGEIDLEAEP